MSEFANLRVTLEEIRRGLAACERNGVPMSAAVLWADNVEIGSKYQLEMGAVPGSVIMGVTFVKDGGREYGTLQFMPGKISENPN